MASIVSAVNLHRDCPPSLLQALASTHPDREVWLQSYYKEKGGIEDMGTFRKITLGEYRALCEKGAPKAILTMCVLLFSGLTVSVSWLACRPNIVGPSNKGIAKTPSVKVFFRLRKQLLSDPPLGTLTLPRTNIGFFSKHYMASVGAHIKKKFP